MTSSATRWGESVVLHEPGRKLICFRGSSTTSRLTGRVASSNARASRLRVVGTQACTSVSGTVPAGQHCSDTLDRNIWPAPPAQQAVLELYTQAASQSACSTSKILDCMGGAPCGCVDAGRAAEGPIVDGDQVPAVAGRAAEASAIALRGAWRRALSCEKAARSLLVAVQDDILPAGLFAEREGHREQEREYHGRAAHRDTRRPRGKGNSGTWTAKEKRGNAKRREGEGARPPGSGRSCWRVLKLHGGQSFTGFGREPLDAESDRSFTKRPVSRRGASCLRVSAARKSHGWSITSR